MGLVPPFSHWRPLFQFIIIGLLCRPCHPLFFLDSGKSSTPSCIVRLLLQSSRSSKHLTAGSYGALRRPSRPVPPWIRRAMIHIDFDGPMLLFSLTYRSISRPALRIRRAGGDVIGLCWGFDVWAVRFTITPLPLNHTVVLQPFPRRIVVVGSPTRSVSVKSRRIFVTKLFRHRRAEVRVSRRGQLFAATKVSSSLQA